MHRYCAQPIIAWQILQVVVNASFANRLWLKSCHGCRYAPQDSIFDFHHVRSLKCQYQWVYSALFLLKYGEREREDIAICTIVWCPTVGQPAQSESACPPPLWSKIETYSLNFRWVFHASWMLPHETLDSHLFFLLHSKGHVTNTCPTWLYAASFFQNSSPSSMKRIHHHMDKPVERRPINLIGKIFNHPIIQHCSELMGSNNS